MLDSEVRDAALLFETFASLLGAPPFNLAPDDPLLRAFFRGATIVELGTGETLCKEGERADAFWVLATGALQVSTCDHAGRSVVVARVDAGNVVGETAFLRGASGFRNATVKAAEPSRLWRVGIEAFDELEARGPHRRWSALRQLDNERMLVRLTTLMEHLGAGALRVLDPVERPLRRGEVVFREGDEARHVYLLTTGSVALYRTQEGQPLLVGMLEPEQCFGELGVLERKPRSLTVVADTDAVVLEIDSALG
jgi:cGMP-dependent protein kinase 2